MNSASPDDASDFRALGLIPPLLEALRRLGHVTPTPIQVRAIPPALSGVDVIGCAQTGTGKTAAFALPILQRLAGTPRRAPRSIRALVLSPTRELAAQIGESFALYGQSCTTRHAVIFGGVSQGAQVQALRAGVDVLIATPGRLEDLCAQRLIDLSHVEVLVLDEVDRMLDQGFLPAVRRVCSKLPRARQSLLYSATLPRELRELALELLHAPVEVSAAPVATPPDEVEQGVYLVAHQHKRGLLEHLLRDGDLTRALVFTRTKHGADRVARQLRAAALGAEAIHGGKSQGSRERTLAAFRNGELRVLVATDLAARGIHVDGISHVINFDMPVDPDSYVHRIGRTARAGARGKAVSLCSPEERDVLTRIERLIRQRLAVLARPVGFDSPVEAHLEGHHSQGSDAPPRGQTARAAPARTAPLPRQRFGRPVFSGRPRRRTPAKASS